jgi:hypothetical protein
VRNHISKRAIRLVSKYLLLATCSFLLASCGIEDYPFIPPVPNANVTASNYNVYVNSPLPVGNNYFLQYNIYYRLYQSGTLESGTGTDMTGTVLSTMNSQLASDINALFSLVQEDSTSATGVSQLQSRSFLQLFGFEWASCYLDFSTSPPRISVNAPSDENPVPDASDLQRYREMTLPNDNYSLSATAISENIPTTGSISDINTAGSQGASGFNYYYIALYIAAAGTDPAAYQPIYSRPTFLGVYQVQ